MHSERHHDELTATDWQHRFDYSDTLILCVGPRSKEFTVHKSVATSSYKFIRAALSNDWKEAKDKRIQLANFAVRHFEIYLHWLYTKQLASQSEGDLDYELLIPLYHIGDYLMDSNFCRHVLQALVDYRYMRNTVPNPQDISLVWQQTTEESPLRKVIRELWMSREIDNAVQCFQERPEYSRDFILGMLAVMVRSHPELVAKKIANKTNEQTRAYCARYMSDLDAEEATKESNE